MKRAIAALTGLIMQSSFAWANLSLEAYEAAKKDQDQSVSLQSYIYGLGHGFSSITYGIPQRAKNKCFALQNTLRSMVRTYFK
jgi:hypothetical protein